MDESKLKTESECVCCKCCLLHFRFSLIAITNLKLYLTIIPPLTKTDMTNMFLQTLKIDCELK